MRSVIVLLVCAAACGDARSTKNNGAPLYVVRGDIEGASPGVAEGEYRATLQWLSLGESALGDCFASHTGADALGCAGLPTVSTLSGADVAVTAVFPAGFSIPVLALPPSDTLLDDDGAVLAFGEVLVYDDVNGNAALDYVSFTAASAVDRVVGTSRQSDETSATYLMYREGPLHDFWRAMIELYACPELPLGFSVVRIDGRAATLCSVDAAGVLMITTSDDDATRTAACRGVPPWTAAPSTYPEGEPPNDAVVTCAPDGLSLAYWRDSGRFCDAAVQQRYDLEGCPPDVACFFDPSDENYWNLIDDPPSWWPCGIAAGCDAPATFSGNATRPGTGTRTANDALFVMPFENLSGRGLLAIADIPDAEADFLVHMYLYAETSEGDGAAIGNYDLDTVNAPPVVLDIERRLPGGELRLVTPTTWGELSISQWSPTACAAVVVSISGYSAPASDGLAAYEIEGVFSFPFPD
jgi:hypothetical protein